MKLIDNFKSFLTDTVNLNKSRLDTATTGIDVVTNFLKSNELFKSLFVSATPQGSYKQRTIIKPASEDLEFDVDLLFEMKIVHGWEAKDYLTNTASQFKLSGIYKDKVDTKNKSRCITIDYDSDFHIDVVPAVRSGNDLYIMNKNTNQFELTDGKGYAVWFENKNILAEGFLVEAVRLIKYIRDIKQTFVVKSILLTTLLGNQVFENDDSNLYSDVPTTLKTVFNRLDTYLQSNPIMPEVKNPILSNELFNRHWDQAKYVNFRDKIHSLNEKINEAYIEPDESISVEKWRLVFGDKFPSLEKAFNATHSDLTLGNVNHALPPQWPVDLQHRVEIDADLYLYIKAASQWKRLSGLNSNGRQLQDGIYIKYKARTSTLQPYIVKWQVVNTGPHAASQKGLRGSFFDGKLLNNTLSDDPLINWESTLYTGKHWIECFIIKDGFLVARSGKFFVNVRNPAYQVSKVF